MRYYLTSLLVLACWLPLPTMVCGQGLVIPRRQENPPGPPLTAQQSVDKMTVPEGFSVEVVAAEPQIVNPVAMCIDAKGRFWVTESFEYPRREAGVGRDRIKVLEDTDQDGQVDRVTVFAEGLNIPSGIAVGHGGVWVANAPDLLFLQDTDGDLKADVKERVVTGFGRTDTHELPNAFTWGPDGWLYGLNGVFNRSHVRYTKANPNYDPKHSGWPFTCAVWRIHPVTREFQVFAEGTSNPWGIAINPVGDFFLSACVIDHLWHITETGYYIRQGGPYPGHTWPMESIVEHKHQKAAYCGIVYFDSEAYPASYRDILYMGNVHAGCLNADLLQREGASYFGKPRPDLLTANDVWCMPVAQKVGPDGCLYILDWYDRYHCYQDANADPAGVDRGKGRLYRLRYQETPRAEPFDLETESSQQLVARLQSPNVFYRQQAQRILVERADRSATPLLDEMVQDASLKTKFRLHALWASEGIKSAASRTPAKQRGDGDSTARRNQLHRLMRDKNSDLRRWAVRLWGDAERIDLPEEEIDALLKHETEPGVLVQWIVAIQKHAYSASRQTEWIGTVLESSAADDTIAHIGWNALRTLSDQAPHVSVTSVLSLADEPTEIRAAGGELAVRLLDKLCDTPAKKIDAIGSLAAGLLMDDALADASDPARRRGFSNRTKQRTLDVLATRTRQRAFENGQLQKLMRELRKPLAASAALQETELSARARVLLALWGESDAQESLAAIAADSQQPASVRLESLQALIFAESDSVVPLVKALLDAESTDGRFQENLINAVGASSEARIADLFLQRFASFDRDMQPKVLELLTQRASWSRLLLDQIERGPIDPHQLNLNQLRRVAGFNDADIQEKVASIYGTIRQGRATGRVEAVSAAKRQLADSTGNPFAGEKVFKTVCAQCHQIYGEGAEVGPDITRNGRNDWNQLLNNVFDPSAVIGPGYQARTIVTADGRVLTGLPVEETEQRVVLKVQGGKTETVPRADIELDKTNEVSMMPDELEKQLTPEQLADLFAFLALDKHPSDASAQLLSGAPDQSAKPAKSP